MHPVTFLYMYLFILGAPLVMLCGIYYLYGFLWSLMAIVLLGVMIERIWHQQQERSRTERQLFPRFLPTQHLRHHEGLSD